MYKLFNAIKHFIKRTVTKSVQEDGDQFYNLKVSNFNKLNISEVIYPYGMCSSPPVNSRAVTFQVLGYEENIFSFVYDPSNRFTGLNVGESKFGNPVLGTFIYFVNTGQVIITSTQGLTINGGNVTINDGNVTVTGGNVSDQSGTTPSMQDMRDLFNNHVHPDPLIGLTGVSTTQM